MGCRCGSVGNAVASNTRSPRFESSHMKYFMMTQYSVNCRNDENKEKDAGMAHFFQKMVQQANVLNIVNMSTRSRIN